MIQLVCVTCTHHWLLALGNVVVCEDCQQHLCPRCLSHDIANANGEVVLVPQSHAASVRASVCGRAN